MVGVGNYAFNGCQKLTDVYYEGTQEDWRKITIGIANARLTNANIHFIVASEGLAYKLSKDGTY